MKPTISLKEQDLSKRCKVYNTGHTAACKTQPAQLWSLTKKRFHYGFLANRSWRRSTLTWLKRMLRPWRPRRFRRRCRTIICGTESTRRARSEARTASLRGSTNSCTRSVVTFASNCPDKTSPPTIDALDINKNWPQLAMFSFGSESHTGAEKSYRSELNTKRTHLQQSLARWHQQRMSRCLFFWSHDFSCSLLPSPNRFGKLWWKKSITTTARRSSRSSTWATTSRRRWSSSRRRRRRCWSARGACASDCADTAKPTPASSSSAFFTQASVNSPLRQKHLWVSESFSSPRSGVSFAVVLVPSDFILEHCWARRSSATRDHKPKQEANLNCCRLFSRRYPRQNLYTVQRKTVQSVHTDVAGMESTANRQRFLRKLCIHARGDHTGFWRASKLTRVKNVCWDVLKNKHFISASCVATLIENTGGCFWRASK